MNSTYAMLLIFGFLAVVLMLEGVFLLWTDTRSPEFKRVRERLQGLVKGESSRPKGGSGFLKQRLFSNSPAVHGFLSNFSWVFHLDKLIVQAGSKRDVQQFLLTSLVAGGAGIVLTLILRWSWFSGGLITLVLIALPWMNLKLQRSKRLQLMEKQLPDALDLICRALRAGHAFSAALSMVGDEAAEPIASEFKTTFDEIMFGVSTKNAMLNLAERVPNEDIRYFVMAVLVQLETGGNLTVLLSSLANLMRERFKLMGKIRVLAAEGKLSAYILTGLPFFLALTLNVINPGYLNILFTDPIGVKMLIGVSVLMVIGIFFLWRIVVIRV